MAFINERIVKSSMGDDVGFVENPEWGYHRNTSEFNKYTEKNYALLYAVISSANNALDFVDPPGVEFRFLADGGGDSFGDRPGLFHRFGREGFDLEHNAEAVILIPYPGHFGAGVTGDHISPKFLIELVPFLDTIM